MRIKKNKNHFAAFTLLEITVVLAIMSILISIVSLTLNRFNEQMKQSAELQEELNHWYQFRSNLWRELYCSDSLRFNNDILTIHSSNENIQYKANNDVLYRKNGESEWIESKIKADYLKEIISDEKRVLEFSFIWKGEPLVLNYLCKESKKQKIDTYFNKLTK
ncbi:MAG: prepilin-type N-terminal cleavage/methylation domain-containing protein [Crocinitomicaceae bacterium]|nr:prepilin-type N-terminal cleavage/methylation domain-containing protein [Crocinitomicaceae bacterium]MCF8434374.1 prepilin-type N-terminal cleavage/methylation domain-containing protein [Crocinitomicaceae bacterium]